MLKGWNVNFSNISWNVQYTLIHFKLVIRNLEKILATVTDIWMKDI